MASNKQFILDVSNAFSNGDVEKFLSFCNEGITWTMIGMDPWVGKDAIRKAMNNPGYPEPPLIHIDEIIESEKHVIVTGTVIMKNSVTGRIESAYCDIYKLENGAISEMKSYGVELNKSESRETRKWQ